jgi:hypothetical protein
MDGIGASRCRNRYRDPLHALQNRPSAQTIHLRCFLAADLFGGIPMGAVLDLLKGEIEKTIQRLDAKQFTPDPVAGKHFSKIASVMKLRLQAAWIHT